MRFLFLPLLILPLCPVLSGQEKPIDPEEVEKAAQRAVKWLISQQHEQGYFIEGNKQPWNKEERRRPRENSNAMTALALMGLMAVGHQPSDPTPEGEAMKLALDYILIPEAMDERGYFGRADGSRMYGHGIVSLMLAEMIGQGANEEQNRLLRDRCEMAIDLILKSQAVEKDKRNEGGWRYEPDSRDSDISVTVWQLMALRAAQNASIKVPKEAIDKAINYVKACYSSPRDADGKPKEMDAPFQYEVGGGNRQFSTTAAGVLSLQVAGAYDAPEVTGGANYLLKSPPEPNESWFFYGMYYYAQGMFQKGGEYAETGREFAARTLLKSQKEDGCWEANNGAERGAGKIYSTSLALLSLSVYHHYLPIYQK